MLQLLNEGRVGCVNSMFYEGREGQFNVRKPFTKSLKLLSHFKSFVLKSLWKQEIESVGFFWKQKTYRPLLSVVLKKLCFEMYNGFYSQSNA